MALKIIWTKNALEHLEDILNYWELRNGTNSYSIKLYKLFQNGLDLLSRYPTSGTKTNNELTVLGIVDMRRNPKFIRKIEE